MSKMVAGRFVFSAVFGMQVFCCRRGGCGGGERSPGDDEEEQSVGTLPSGHLRRSSGTLCGSKTAWAILAAALVLAFEEVKI